MKNAIILHGRPTKEIYYSAKHPSSSNFAWIPWLQKQLMINDIQADTPEVPRSYEPNYKVWKKEFERFDITKETSLIGHSAGAGFLVRWLSEKPDIEIDKMILVAPGFSLFEGNLELIDEKISKRIQEFVIFISDNDPGNSIVNTKVLQKKIDGIQVRELKGFGHFTPDHMATIDFPELLKTILSN